MRNAIRSGIARTRIDRRTVLHYSAAGLAIPVLAVAGRPAAGGAAHGVAEDLVDQLELAHAPEDAFMSWLLAVEPLP